MSEKMDEPADDGNPRARTILIPFRRPLWQNLLVPVCGLSIWVGAYALTFVLLGNVDIAAGTANEAIAARRHARIAATFVMCVYFAVATGFGFGWPMLNFVFPLFLPALLPNSAYVLFSGPVPEDIFTTGEYSHLKVGTAHAQWFADFVWVGVAAAVGLIGTLVIFERVYLTTYERKKAFLDRLPKF
ncbi:MULTISPECIES: hypothetical protein [Haloferax]|uniref:Uncharacterized protein n=1 Tax=Haloferax marinum TaxID=2666143 RepID=A0A6A8G5U2_9EURY|nr:MULTISPECIES: hypothetical protein [Haloferax]KAB1196498.1 hypothetical protein Hfx1150_02770 [Haloferax sp. CBA1150]MRW95496.1 hypothetical protein [Haloferax marinum]